MEHLAEILKKRATPGVLIIDFNDQLLYCNEEAMEMIPELRDPGASGEGLSVPPEIYRLCGQVKSTAGSGTAQQLGTENSLILHRSEGLIYTLRAFLMGSSGDGGTPTHIMVLVEKIVDKHQIDFERAKKDFTLSVREVEVLRLICQGLGNKEIAEKLFISEYTVKDHIKKLMEKMESTTRSEIISRLK